MPLNKFIAILHPKKGQIFPIISYFTATVEGVWITLLEVILSHPLIIYDL